MLEWPAQQCNLAESASVGRRCTTCDVMFITDILPRRRRSQKEFESSQRPKLISFCLNSEKEIKIRNVLQMNLFV